MNCPDCERPLKSTATACSCGWGSTEPTKAKKATSMDTWSCKFQTEGRRCRMRWTIDGYCSWHHHVIDIRLHPFDKQAFKAFLAKRAGVRSDWTVRDPESLWVDVMGLATTRGAA